MSNSTVGESAEAAPSVTLMLLISHMAPVQDFIVSALLARELPNISINERSLAVTSSSFLASCAFQASHTDLSTATIASVLGSGVGAAGLGSSFFSARFVRGAGAGLCGIFGSVMRVFPWENDCHF